MRSRADVVRDSTADYPFPAFQNSPLREIGVLTLAAVERQEPPGAMLRYHGRLTTPSACPHIVLVLTASSRFGCWTVNYDWNMFSLQHDIRCSRNVLI
jgi:hypothetical protein